MFIKGFDVQAYLEANIDVKNAIEKGDFSSIEIYLEKFGLDRIKYGDSKFHLDFDVFDEAYYLREFSEVREAVEYETFTSAFDHFCKFGYAEIISGVRFWKKLNIEKEYKTEKELMEDQDFPFENIEMGEVFNIDVQDRKQQNVYSFIPFTTSVLPKGSTLIFAPHPDDETFGMGGSIIKMGENDTVVNVVMMTDGAEGGDKGIRKKELLNAIKILGVNEIEFFGAPDQGLINNSENIYNIVQLLKKYRPLNVFFPSPLEYHPDHRTTAWLVWNALQGISYRGNVFSYEIANQSPVNTLVDITSYMDKKLKAMECYSSQQAQLDYIGTITSMNQLRAYTAPESTKYAEAFYHFEDIDSDLMSYYYEHLHQYHQNFYARSMPLVSVLVRTKNRPQLLQRALASIWGQTYQKLEINIVNDGGEEIEHIVDKFDFERCFVKNNIESKGRAGAANDLLKMVNGQYVIFLDDDDVFDSGHIDNLVRVMQRNNSILAIYSAIRVGEGLKEQKIYNKPYNAALLRRGNYIPFHSVLFSSKLIEKGCHFDDAFLIYEDWDFWLQVSQHTVFYFLNKVSATYHMNGTSGAGGASENSISDIDQDHFKQKVYEKWLKVWTPKQLEETFNAIAQLRH